MFRIFCAVLFLLPISVLAKASSACSVDVFMKKVCVANEPSDLSGEEVGHLKCVDPASAPDLRLQVRQAFLRAPSWLQSYFCSVSGVGIYPTMPGSRTLSWSYFDKNFIGLSRQFLEAGHTLEAHEVVMRRQSLNKKKLPNGVSFPDGFGFEHSGDDSGLGVLYLMAHEVGHLIYNAPLPPAEYGIFGGRCTIFGEQRLCRTFREGEWGLLSWITGQSETITIDYGVPQPENEKLVSFIRSSNTAVVTLAQEDHFFHEVFNSSFATAFAVYSPEEDFCETLAAKVVADNLDEWVFRFLDGSTIDVKSRFKTPENPILQKKLDFLHKYFEGKLKGTASPD